MQGKHLYEYAVIRVVPRVEREEFVNVGVILCSKKEKFLESMIHLDEGKLLALDPEVDLELLRDYLESFTKICQGTKSSSPIAQMDPASRFRWLTAQRSSMIQTSRPHGGLTEDLNKTLDELFAQFVA
jgi:hypothetical protein